MCVRKIFVTLSVTEAECVSAPHCVQDMMFGKRLLESMGLKIKLPMTLYMDNKGGVDIFNNWSITGNTRAGENNSADLLTKNLDWTYLRGGVPEWRWKPLKWTYPRLGLKGMLQRSIKHQTL
jgi:hypothetical protein